MKKTKSVAPALPQIFSELISSIEKNIPVPPRGLHTKGAAEAVLRSMEPGDSLVVNLRLRQTLAVWARKLSMTITTRKVDEGQFRVWRVS